MLWVDKQDVKRLRKLGCLSHRGVVEYPPELTMPKDQARREEAGDDRGRVADQ